eukprot:TRINITY_DN6868_c0_g1_i2.p2 TRINITY_DN6868_c0_g1~~TRINITY_DN6868_c0_g1_i2.p2  ORF type:complete len:227 (+),score=36.07 TRINITY_DN6868_c0_g1_i2:103-783(+)
MFTMFTPQQVQYVGPAIQQAAYVQTPMQVMTQSGQSVGLLQVAALPVPPAMDSQGAPVMGHPLVMTQAVAPGIPLHAGTSLAVHHTSAVVAASAVAAAPGFNPQQYHGPAHAAGGSPRHSAQRPAGQRRTAAAAAGTAAGGPVRHVGAVVAFGHKKGYGFIDSPTATAECGRQIFVHQTEARTICSGCIVEFTVVQSKKGPLAKNVKILYHPTKQGSGADAGPTGV